VSWEAVKQEQLDVDDVDDVPAVLEILASPTADWEHEQEPAEKKKNSEPEDGLHNRIRNFFKR
jgi:hypothetical protein